MSTHRRSLFEISNDWLAVEQALDDCGGDISDPVVEAAITKIIEGLLEEEGAKLDGMVRFMKQLDMEGAAARAEEEQWAKRANAKEGLAKRIKRLMHEHLLRTNRNRLLLPSGLILKVHGNGGKMPVEIDLVDPESVPDHLCKVTRRIDSDAVRAILEAGKNLEFARLLSRGTHLKIQ